LEEIRPAAISLEVSPASVDLRLRWSRDWMKVFKSRLEMVGFILGVSPSRLMAGAGLRGVFEYLRLPYEYRAARAYALERDVPLFLLDDSKLAASYLNRVQQEILTEDNLRLLAENGASENLADQVKMEYGRARAKLFGPTPWPGPRVRDREAWARREADLAQKLRLLHQGLSRRAGRVSDGEELAAGLIVAPDAVAHMPRRLSLEPGAIHLYIGGWEHLADDPNGESFYSRLKDLEPERRLIPSSNQNTH
jgi:hypothetical protein